MYLISSSSSPQVVPHPRGLPMATAASARRFAINAEVQSGLKIYMEMMFENVVDQNEYEPMQRCSQA